MTTTQTRVATVATYVLWRARAARVTHPEGHFVTVPITVPITVPVKGRAVRAKVAA